MKSLIQLLFISFLVFIFSIHLSAQKNSKIQLIGGITFSTEYLYGDLIDDKLNNNFGVFGQVQLGKRFSSVTSFNYAHRKYMGNATNSFGWCGVGLTEEFIAFSTYGFQEKAWSIEQLFKLHFNHRKASYFIGAGGIVKLPQHVQGLPRDEPSGFRNIYIAPHDSEYLDKRFGFLSAVGFDYRCWENILFSAQLNWNVFQSNIMDGLLIPNYHLYGIYNPNSLNFKMSVGYVF